MNKNGFSIVEMMLGLALGGLCIAIVMHISAGPLSDKRQLRTDDVMGSFAEFRQQIRDELEGAGFQIQISNQPGQVFICALQSLPGNVLNCLTPAQSYQPAACIVSSKQQANGAAVQAVISGFRRVNQVLQKYRQTFPLTAVVSEKSICEEPPASPNWQPMHRTSDTKVSEFRVCLASIQSPADLLKSSAPNSGMPASLPANCNYGAFVRMQPPYQVVSDAQTFLWFYIASQYTINNTDKTQTFLVSIPNKPTIVVP